MHHSHPVIHFISNTHWDREWLSNFQDTRMQLVEMLDGLLDLLDGNPAYRAFLLDGQTVPLEDYLEVRPEQGGRLRGHVAAGRIQVGPWYTDPEGFCVGGESLVRNLLMGHRVAGALGGVMKVGHTPFGYGQNSQMPQIYQGFGIGVMLFYHGVSHEEVANEWLFEGADGSRVLASQMSSMARYNAYHHVYRAALYGDRLLDREYDWKKGGLPFRLCRDEAALRHHRRLRVEPGWHEELMREELIKLRASEEAAATTRHLAFMMGHDSSVPDERELDIIEAARRLFPDAEVRHDSLPEMMAAIAGEVDPEALTVLRGERRTPKPMPVIMHLYSDVLSSRTRMKLRNAEAEALLLRRTEPLAVWAAQLGWPWPGGLLELAWKTLLRCHAHDSIAGSGVDDIERDMMHRLRQVRHIATSLLRDALGHLQASINHGKASEEDVLVTVFNPSPWARDEVVSAVLELPHAGPRGEFTLVDQATGEEAPVQMLTRRPAHRVANHPGDAPQHFLTERFEVHFPAAKVPAMGYRSYRVDRTGAFARARSLVTAANTLENEHLRLRIEDNGSWTVLHKASGQSYRDLHYFLDNGEAGHAWMHHDPARDQVVDSRGFPVRIALEEDGPFLARFRVHHAMEIPEDLDEAGGDAWQRLDGLGSSSCRSGHTVPLPITSWVTLRRGAEAIEVETRLDNQARRHRLRVLFPTRREGSTCHAETAFDVVERETAFSPESPWHGCKGVTFPMQRFVDVADQHGGLAVLAGGLREYEVTQNQDRAIAITLMRAFQVSLSTVSMRWEELPEMELAQCPGAHTFHYRVAPHGGGYAGTVLDEAERMTAPLEVAQAGRHAGHLPPAMGFLEVRPQSLVLDAVKRGEDGQGFVLRLHNPTGETIRGEVTFHQAPASVTELTLEEQPVAPVPCSGTRAAITVGPKKIFTLGWTPGA